MSSGGFVRQCGAEDIRVEDAKEHISRVWAVEFYPVGPLRARMDEDGYRHRRSPSPADVDVESNEDLDLGSHLVFPAE